MMMLRGKPFDSWEEYRWFQEKKKKNILQTDYYGDKSCREKPGEKNSCSQKNIGHAWKKSYTIVTLEKKISISRGLGKIIAVTF